MKLLKKFHRICNHLENPILHTQKLNSILNITKEYLIRYAKEETRFKTRHCIKKLLE